MHEARQSPKDRGRRERLVARLDQMVASGRVTAQVLTVSDGVIAEADRLRAAVKPDEFDNAVLEIRVRHAGTILDAAVQDGSLTQEEAGGLLERLRNGEHPRWLRAQLRGHRPGGRARAAAPGSARPGDDPGQDSSA